MRVIVSLKSMWRASCGDCCHLDFVISVMKACYYWSHKLNLLTSFHTPGTHVVTSGQCPMSWWPHILTPMPPWLPDPLSSPLPWLWWLLVTTLTSVSHSGLVKSLVTNPHHKHHTHEPVTRLLIIRSTVYSRLPRTLFTWVLFIRREDHIDNICGTCKLWAKCGPLTVSSCDGRETRIRGLLRSGVRRVQTKKCREWASVPHPDTASTWWPLTMGGAVSHSRPLLMWHPHTHQTQWFCNWLCFLLS